MKSVVAIKKKKADTFWKSVVDKTRKEAKRKKLDVSFYDFVPGLRPCGVSLAPIPIYKTAMERWIEEEMKYVGMEFLIGRMCIFEINDFERDQADRDYHWSYWLKPWQNEERALEDSADWKRRVKERKNHGFGCGALWVKERKNRRFWSGPFVGHERVFRNFIMPAAAAYVLNGRLKNRFKSFHGDYYGWLAAIRQDYVGGVGFWKTVQQRLYEAYCHQHGIGSWMRPIEQEAGFWSEYRAARPEVVVNIFHLWFERFARDLWDLIDRFEYLFERPTKSLEIRIEKTAWENLVVEWVERKEDEELYIQLYETEGALAWYRDFVVPEREIENDRQWSVWYDSLEEGNMD